jgi:hydroxypyruvate reductase
MSDSDLKQVARTLFDHALAECSIERAFERKLRVVTDAEGTRLLVEGCAAIALDRLRQVRIVAVGKASAAMLQSLLARLPLASTCELQGVLIAAESPANLPAAMQYFCGSHPVPNEASFAAARAALDLLRTLGNASADETLCLFLISGGASAMMELPLDPAISLDDTIAFHRALVHSGASIVEMNCLRKHFSAVKGGRLALAAGRSQCLSLLVSDVPPQHLDALGSGPTLADSSTVADCREILARYGLMERFPASVQRFFASADLPETPKPEQLEPFPNCGRPICLSFRSEAKESAFVRSATLDPTSGNAPNARICKLVDSNAMAEAARHHAASLGFHAVIDNTCDDWSYNAAADYLLTRLRELRREHSRVCLISAGEVAVRVESSTANARGGRNQHFALYLATQLRTEDAPLAILSAGSDGIDGNSDAAGAIVDTHTLDSNTLDQASHHAEALRALAAFDSSTFLASLHATLTTGPTGHNLRDLRILLAEAESC